MRRVSTSRLVKVSSCGLNCRAVEQLAESPKGAAGLALDSPGADSQGGSGLLFGQVMPEPEHHDRALPVGQGADRTNQLISVIVQADDVGCGVVGAGQSHAFAPDSGTAPIAAQV